MASNWFGGSVTILNDPASTVALVSPQGLASAPVTFGRPFTSYDVSLPSSFSRPKATCPANITCKVVVWGDNSKGHIQSDVPDTANYGQNGGVKAVATTALGAYAAVMVDGSVEVWGDSDSCGSGMPGILSNPPSPVTHIASKMSAFAALHADGTVTAWGNPTSGGDKNRPSINTNVVPSGLDRIRRTGIRCVACRRLRICMGLRAGYGAEPTGSGGETPGMPSAVVFRHYQTRGPPLFQQAGLLCSACRWGLDSVGLLTLWPTRCWCSAPRPLPSCGRGLRHSHGSLYSAARGRFHHDTLHREWHGYV